MVGDRWKIYWNEHAKDTYLYGSEVTFVARDHVEFKNELMPPGTIIKKWYSKVNYQMRRIEPSLPMIDGECKYKITADLSDVDIQTYLLRIMFFDRYGSEAGSVIVRNGEAEFKCPMKTYSYEIHLIAAGMKSFTYHSMTITEIADVE